MLSDCIACAKPRRTSVSSASDSVLKLGSKSKQLT